ncbi:MAG TPA: extracellular solute-binding protein [Steroidobacteraceae bacterium]|nr:extracellular solute-binding protein [Steroidobacteraceae bacterium]
MTVALRGMAWDHPRARYPLEAIAADWMRTHDARVDWDARPLKAFEDQPLEELASAYDLVLIDHPFVATAARSGLIAPVDDWADANYLEDQAAHSVGPSHASYSWDGKQWALAIDAACQVSAVRDDLWSASQSGPLPDTWAEVVELAESLRAAPSRVAIPLNENHAYCAFLSVGVSLAGHSFWRAGHAVEPAAGRESLLLLRRLATHVHPLSREADPIAISERMVHSDEIVYVPLMFGYSSYARPGFRPQRLGFGDAPLGPSGARGTVLGGVGLAVSARRPNSKAAAELARYIASPHVQRGLYARAGGQPGHAAAWESSSVNEQTGQFFVATRRSIDQAFVRPRVSGHRPFQPLAGALIHGFIWGQDGSAEKCLEDYARLAQELLADWRERP